MYQLIVYIPILNDNFISFDEREEEVVNKPSLNYQPIKIPNGDISEMIQLLLTIVFF